MRDQKIDIRNRGVTDLGPAHVALSSDLVQVGQHMVLCIQGKDDEPEMGAA